MQWLVFAGLCACLLGGPQVGLAESYPPDAWRDTPSALASPDAVRGGTITAYAGPSPQSFNYYLDNNTFCAQIFSMMYDSLLGTDPVTAEYVPALARKWEISDDKKTFTFWLDEDARWSDGRPVTAQDVAWTFAAIMDPKNLTGVHKVSLEPFAPPEVLDERTVRFTARDVHWRHLGAAGGFSILPQHALATQDFNKINFEFPVVSGPYRIGETKSGIFATMERRPDWWGDKKPANTHMANFDKILFRFLEDQENAYEAFKKGLIDVYPVYMARLWMNEAQGEKFDKHWIVKQKIHNHGPIGFQGFAMNLRRPPFDDVRVRQAMALLLDREKMNQTLMYGQYFLHRSYFEDLYSPQHPCTNPATAFDKARARELLQAAGWTANPDTGWLEKDGRRFTFSFLTRDASTDKFLAIYAEDLKDVGIDMTIDHKDWAAWSKDMDEYNYDMTWASWSGTIFKDPEDMWSSREADRAGGNNITGFKDPRVDALIAEQKSNFDIQQRNAIYRQIDALILEQAPYVLLWNMDYVRLLYWNKFGTPPTVLSKFGREDSAFGLWWFDEDSAAELAAAMASGGSLPARPAEVRFDDVFKP